MKPAKDVERRMAKSDKDSNELAEERTDWAEDRTIMANERTFAGWMRTGMACVGLGLGFNALFGTLEPLWVPKAIATLFIGIGIFIFWAAERKSCKVVKRLHAHQAEPVRSGSMQLIAGAMTIASLSLILALWLLDIET
jgi:putative membrane protein